MISGGWSLEARSCVTGIEVEPLADGLPAGSGSSGVADDGADQLVDRGPTYVQIGQGPKGVGSVRVSVLVVAPPDKTATR